MVLEPANRQSLIALYGWRPAGPNLHCHLHIGPLFFDGGARLQKTTGDEMTQVGKEQVTVGAR